ncbi:MAG: c-type cytochrome [Edaphobacter sp.]|uniref:cytochrome c n=1 Tax=Edaphobacter sp. TaxID=1934404 RepID=UPI002390A633|nr:c-type cytochrome [Edaphobacter sp.]MDE1178775.1 c-type cytochrome [Edaphobacter sp.]
MTRSVRLQYGKAVPFAAMVLALAPLAGCRQDMHDQPKFFPQRGTTMFADGRSVRPQVVNTVARSQAESPSYFTTGLVEGGAEGDGMPYKVTPAVLERGQERYNVYCTPCHSRVGNGKGMVVERGYYAATSFHSYRLRSAPLGHFFNVMSNGYGAMPDYAAQITPVDRWAIAAYIRVLQLSQNATQSDVPSGAHVMPIAAVEENAGFSKNFLAAWLEKPHANYVVPAMATPSATTTPAPVTTPTTVSPLAAASAGAKAPVVGGSAAGKATQMAALKTPAAPGAPSGHQDAAPAPAKAAGGAGNAEHGKALYSANCSMCHQPNRAGMPPVFPSLVGVVDRVGEKRVRTVAKEGIPEGKPPMPPHPNLTDDDITDLLAFLKTKP